MREALYFIAACLFTACNSPSNEKSATSENPICRGSYASRDAQGNLKNWNEYEVNGQCFTDNVPLTQFEATTENWRKNDYSCSPVLGFTSRTLISANNFYNYRDGKQYLDLDASTGIYRKITLAEGKSGQSIITRLQGCFYVRGNQLLLDVIHTISSQYFDPMEVFEFVESTTTMEMVRFDNSGDWDFRFCPYLDTPWSFCTDLRDGNEMYWPNLSLSKQSALLAEALLIRKQFNYQSTTRKIFNNLWDNVDNRVEGVREDYKFAVQTIVDTPIYIDQAYAQYVRNERPTMPDVTSTRIPPICYDAWRTVILNDGTTNRIQGEVCYVNGEYVFAQ